MDKPANQLHAASFGFWTICALVLLRLAVGWHFYTEGVKKLEPGFSAAGLLTAAKGPLAPIYNSFVPQPGRYQELLATPRASGSINPEQAAQNAEWRAAYAEEVKRSKKAKETPLAEFAPHSPYSDWAAELQREWAAKRDRAAAMAGGDAAALAETEEVYRQQLQRLADYLSSEADAIEAYRHELWRLERLQASPGAVGLDFREQRVADKKAETWATSRKWSYSVNVLQADYIAELAALTPEPASVERRLQDASALDWINPTVTYVVIGIGVCMLLGMCTRLAGVIGALFLLSVMASQPPWLPESDTTYLGYQMAEVGAMLTLAATGAGRWYGIDSVMRRCCSLFCGR